MKKIYKDGLYEIKNNIKRFISMILIVLLGVGFFAGIKATSPDMKKSIDKYFKDNNVFDVEVISTLGLTDDDINQISSIEDIEKVEGSYSKDALLEIDESEMAVKLHSLLDNINNVELKQGRMPENANECLVEERFLKNTGKQIGDTIEFKIEKEDEEEDFLKNNQMTICGAIESPLYISRERGSTKLASGKINYYVYIPKDSINSNVYTEIYAKINNDENELTSSKKYNEKIKEVKEKIEEISIKRKEERYKEVYDEANNEIIDAQKELDENKKEADEKILDAENKIQDAKNKIESSEQEIEENETKANNEFKKAENEIKKAEQEISSNKKALEEGKAEANSKIEEANNQKATLEKNKSDLENGITTANESRNELLQNKSQINYLIGNLQKQLENENDETKKQEILNQINTNNQILQQLESGIQEADNKINELQTNLNTVSSGIAQIDTEVKNAQNTISENESKLKSAEKELTKQKKKFESTKKTTIEKIENGKKEIEKAKSEIAENEKKLEDEKRSAEEKITDAQNKIDEAKDKINDIKRPDYYILDRKTNIGYEQYIQDSDRIANIGKVFPVVFFVVAALISLNSMNRLVEENRVQIGTFKALGYGKIKISSKYVIYAILATIIGSILGVSIGFKLIPTIILKMYGMMYNMPENVIEFNKELAVTGLFWASICTVGSTIYTCIKQLRETPSQLMRSKSPKTGKKVFLEKIPFIWKRLKFSQKVTVRNVFRYKKRFLMTIIGIMGCTSLIVAGFGLRDSISGMIPMQYEEISKYEITTTFKDGVTRTNIQEGINKIFDIEKIKDSKEFNMQSVEITDRENTQTIQLVIPKDNENLDEYIELRDRKTNKKYTINDEGIIITEKIANLLNIKKGDRIKIKNADDKEAEVEVSEITENYIMHYIYMSPGLYNKIYNENPKYNVLLSKTYELSEEEEAEIGRTILQNKDISNVSFTSSTQNMFDEVMNNMNLVVWVLIVAAGLLAFVVLYNLANVNISERIRELATIKVLGFYDNEVYNYLNRETIILTAIGTIIGLVGGYYLNMFILKTCELDMFMFKQTVKIQSYVYGVLITVLFSTIVNILTYFALKKIDMIESLKSVE